MHSICAILNRCHWSWEFSSEITNHIAGWVHLSLTKRKEQKDDRCFWSAEVKGEGSVRWSWGNGCLLSHCREKSATRRTLDLCGELWDADHWDLSKKYPKFLYFISVTVGGRMVSLIAVRSLLFPGNEVTEMAVAEQKKSCTGIYEGSWCD